MPGAGDDRGGAARRARSQWRVRLKASRDDLGTTLVDALAWAGDRLSSYAERVADEAYLGGGRHGLAHPGRPPAELGIWVDVGGTRWRQVPDFGRSGSDDQHYVVGHDDNGATVIEFGDGMHGPSTVVRRLHRRALPRWDAVLVRSPAAGPGHS